MSKLLNGTAILGLAIAGLVLVSAPSHAGSSHSAAMNANTHASKNSAEQTNSKWFDSFDETAKKKYQRDYDPKVESDDHPIKPEARGRFGGHSVNE